MKTLSVAYVLRSIHVFKFVGHETHVHPQMHKKWENTTLRPHPLNLIWFHVELLWNNQMSEILLLCPQALCSIHKTTLIYFYKRKRRQNRDNSAVNYEDDLVFLKILNHTQPLAETIQALKHFSHLLNFRSASETPCSLWCLCFKALIIILIFRFLLEKYLNNLKQLKDSVVISAIHLMFCSIRNWRN